MAPPDTCPAGLRTRRRKPSSDSAPDRQTLQPSRPPVRLSPATHQRALSAGSIRAAGRFKVRPAGGLDAPRTKDPVWAGSPSPRDRPLRAKRVSSRHSAARHRRVWTDGALHTPQSQAPGTQWLLTKVYFPPGFITVLAAPGAGRSWCLDPRSTRPPAIRCRGHREREGRECPRDCRRPTSCSRNSNCHRFEQLADR
jgi:hypothetical protein